MSERSMAEGTEVLECGVRATARQLQEFVACEKANTLDRVTPALHQEVGEQTTRMAGRSSPTR